MNGNQGKRLTPEALSKEFTIKFTRAQLTVLFNVLHEREWRLPDARLANDIVDLIKGPVTVLSNQDYESDIVPTPQPTPEDLVLDPKEVVN